MSVRPVPAVTPPAAYKRDRQPVTEFDGFRDGFRDSFRDDYGLSNNWRTPPGGASDLLLGDWGYGDYDEGYDDYDDFDQQLPDPWENTDPKYVNGKQVLVNLQITAKQLRIQGADKSDMGITPREEAFAIAREEGLDLVLISPDASPPLARLIDFSKYKYEMERATKERQKASSKGQDTKELRLRPVTEEHDYQVKLKQAQGFLSKGARVKLSMSFSGRELRFKDQGKELMLRFVEDLATVGKVDGAISFRTGAFSATLAPKK